MIERFDGVVAGACQLSHLLAHDVNGRDLHLMDIVSL